MFVLTVICGIVLFGASTVQTETVMKDCLPGGLCAMADPKSDRLVDVCRCATNARPYCYDIDGTGMRCRQPFLLNGTCGGADLRCGVMIVEEGQEEAARSTAGAEVQQFCHCRGHEACKATSPDDDYGHCAGNSVNDAVTIRSQTNRGHHLELCKSGYPWWQPAMCGEFLVSINGFIDTCRCRTGENCIATIDDSHPGFLHCIPEAAKVCCAVGGRCGNATDAGGAGSKIGTFCACSPSWDTGYQQECTGRKPLDPYMYCADPTY